MVRIFKIDSWRELLIELLGKWDSPRRSSGHS